MKNIKVSSATVERYDDKDFIFMNDIVEKPSLNFWNTGEKQYNQYEIHQNSCFLHGPAGCITDITGYKFTEEELLELRDAAWESPYADPAWGGYFNYGTKSLCNFYNRHHASKYQKLSYYRIPYSEFEKALDKGYSIVAGYHTSRDYTKDKNDDGDVNHSNGEYGYGTGGHCVRLTKKDGQIYVVDNYEGLNKYNVYKIDDIYKEIEDGRFFTNGYIIVIKEDVKDGYEGLSIADKIKKLANRFITKK